MEFTGAAKVRKSAARGILLEYSFDRLWEKKVIQAYQLLMPVKSWATGNDIDESRKSAESLSHEAGGNLRTSVLGAAKRRAHHRESDSSSHGACGE
jgi:hypothetical protein